MNPGVFLYSFFHNQTNDRTEGGLKHVPTDKSMWPKSWTTISYKKYPLFGHIPLPQTDGLFFKEMLSKRRSALSYIKKNNLTLETLSYLLKCGYGLQECPQDERREEHRTVPSAGFRLPLEIYVFLFKELDSQTSGIYHYGIKNHVLEPILFQDFSEETINEITPIEPLQKCHAMICVTSIFERVVDKYGSRGYRYALLEAGHVAQNILLAGAERNLFPLPVGGVNESVIEKLLMLSPEDEQVVYTLFI